ncbi:hypothetical protein, partial [Paenibacillus sp. OAS669]|uniref:hypothetical protein n=1 Tax=Paenibacillus sp. OAS669 TaxID=2663821 RepID=UPI001CEF1AA0
IELVLSSKFNASENFHSLFKHSLVVQFSKDNVLLIHLACPSLSQQRGISIYHIALLIASFF